MSAAWGVFLQLIRISFGFPMFSFTPFQRGFASQASSAGSKTIGFRFSFKATVPTCLRTSRSATPLNEHFQIGHSALEREEKKERKFGSVPSKAFTQVPTNKVVKHKSGINIGLHCLHAQGVGSAAAPGRRYRPHGSHSKRAIVSESMMWCRLLIRYSDNKRLSKSCLGHLKFKKIDSLGRCKWSHVDPVAFQPVRAVDLLVQLFYL